MRRRRWQLVLGASLGLGLLGSAGSAWAGDAGGGTGDEPSISPELEAARFVAGSDAGAPAHFQNFSPLAINYLDCINPIDIQIALNISNPDPSDEIQVWAGTGSADCTDPAARTAVTSSSPNTFPGRCWPVAPPGTFSTSTPTARLHVLDLVAYIGWTNPPISYTETTLATNPKVCQPLATSSAVPLNIYFIFVPSGSGSGGTDGGTLSAAQPPNGISGLYQTPAALVGPIAPTGVSVPNTGITPNSLTVGWVPQSQSIIQGFAIYVEDQGAGGKNAGNVNVDASAVLELSGIQCHPALMCDAGGPTIQDAGQDAGTAADATTDAHDAAVDAGASHDATLADAKTSPSGSGCDAGLSSAWVPVDAAAYANASDASLAASGCEFYTYPTNKQTTPTQTNTVNCTSSVLKDDFTVDGGLGSAAVAAVDASTGLLTTVSGDDAGDEAGFDSGESVPIAVDAGGTSLGTPTNVPEVAGISSISQSRLAYYASGQTTNAYTITGLTTGDQYAVGVAAVDSYGNVGPLGSALSPTTGATSGILACSTPTAVDDFLTQYGYDGGQAGGGFCTLTAVGAPAPFFASIFGAGFVGAAAARRGRRRKQRSKR